MPDFAAWLSDSVDAIDAPTRAARAWARIQRKPLPVVFTRPRRVLGDGTVIPETQLPAQVVRVESDDRASVVEGVAGVAPRRHVVVFGVRGHPTQPDTDMQEGYTFSAEGDPYRVTDVIVQPGEVQGIAVATG